MYNKVENYFTDQLCKTNIASVLAGYNQLACAHPLAQILA